MAKIRGRKSNYLKKLNATPYWNEVRRLIRLRDRWNCRICGKNTDLDVHHITYSVNGVSIVANEKDNLNWLILLCRDDHQAVHNDINHVLNPKNPKKIDAENFKND